jgi:uncharacterized membrane protein
MRKIIGGAVIFMLIAFVTQWVVVKEVPSWVYKIAIHRTDHQFNKWINSGNTDAKMRRVVMPNPDFVYSALFYDVTHKTVTISGILPDSTYASVSFYDDRCQPYYVYNNLDATRKGKFELNLGNSDKTEAHAIRAKTGRGVVICRFLKSTDSSYQQLVPFQKVLSCEVH